MSRVPLSVPVMEGNERDYLNECIDSGFVSSVGPFVDRFEEAFAARVGRKFAVACSSGTSALHVALVVAGVKAGTHVPVSDLTFIASANAIAYCGAAPVLVDSEINSWNLNCEIVADHITDSARRGRSLPAAIEVVHLLGVPADLEPLEEIRQRFGIVIVEDAAEALGARFGDGLEVGAFGDIACFSFNGNKIITSGGGGMIACDDPELARRARHLTTQARLPGGAYQHDEIGFNYRLTNIAAAVGLAQLEQLDEFLHTRRHIEETYRAHLMPDERFRFPEAPQGGRSSSWLTSFQCPDEGFRDALIERLDREGVEARPIWRPMSAQDPYSACDRLGDGRIASHLAATSVSVPSSVNLDDTQIGRICEVICDA